MRRKETAVGASLKSREPVWWVALPCLPDCRVQSAQQPPLGQPGPDQLALSTLRTQIPRTAGCNCGSTAKLTFVEVSRLMVASFWEAKEKLPLPRGYQRAPGVKTRLPGRPLG